MDSKEIKSVNTKENQSWMFIGRIGAKAETPILWPPDVKNWLIGKDPDAGKEWRWEEKGMTEDEMVGWHHWLLGHEFEETLRDSEGQGSLACWSPWGLKELEMTEWLNRTEDSKCVQSSGYIVWFNVEMKSKLTQSEAWNDCLMLNVWDVVSPARWTTKNKVGSESCLLFGDI